jgi:plastocyanin
MALAFTAGTCGRRGANLKGEGMSRFLVVRAGLVLAAGLVVAVTAVAVASGNASTRNVQILDACDPATFDAAVGPGTCTRPGGGVKHSEFILQLQTQGEAPAWRFSPEELDLATGGTLLATNRGGEDHTFTEVAAFGGGCIAPLNVILGLTPVPECSTPGLFNSTLVEQGDTLDVSGLKVGVHRFECLIHPWMRTTVVVR